MTDNERLASDDELILALAEGATVPEAAERAGVSERTVCHRLHDAEFRQAVSEMRGRAFDAAALQETGTQPPSTEVAENGRQCEVRWR
ncbi:MAG TPA: helix-turn-helix domain-containing protein [Pirellulales bacterium]|jgi:hypothetical protein|nr:helix-turn-helix domain-containing protein [Pirellulales bacterium]